MHSPPSPSLRPVQQPTILSSVWPSFVFCFWFWFWFRSANLQHAFFFLSFVFMVGHSIRSFLLARALCAVRHFIQEYTVAFLRIKVSTAVAAFSLLAVLRANSRYSEHHLVLDVYFGASTVVTGWQLLWRSRSFFFDFLFASSFCIGFPLPIPFCELPINSHGSQPPKTGRVGV